MTAWCVLNFCLVIIKQVNLLYKSHEIWSWWVESKWNVHVRASRLINIENWCLMECLLGSTSKYLWARLLQEELTKRVVLATPWDMTIQHWKFEKEEENLEADTFISPQPVERSQSVYGSKRIIGYSGEGQKECSKYHVWTVQKDSLSGWGLRPTIVLERIWCTWLSTGAVTPLSCFDCSSFCNWGHMWATLQNEEDRCWQAQNCCLWPTTTLLN